MASYLPDLARDNISFYTIPVAWVVAFMPRIYAITTYAAATKKDTKAISLQPRDFVKITEAEQGLDNRTKQRIIRGEAAMTNGFENLGMFAAAVAAGNAAGLSASTLNGISIAYLVSRVVYNHIYIFNDLVPSQVRTVTFLSGVGMCWALFIQAGNRMKRTLL